jgi:hypothetical protein
MERATMMNSQAERKMVPESVRAIGAHKTPSSAGIHADLLDQNPPIIPTLYSAQTLHSLAFTPGGQP